MTAKNSEGINSVIYLVSAADVAAGGDVHPLRHTPVQGRKQAQASILAPDHQKNANISA